MSKDLRIDVSKKHKLLKKRTKIKLWSNSNFFQTSALLLDMCDLLSHPAGPGPKDKPMPPHVCIDLIQAVLLKNNPPASCVPL